MRRVTANITDGLAADLLEACEKSGRSMTAEIEARLRDSLNSRGSDRLLLLRFDEGLWAWLKAYVTGWGLWGSTEETAIFMIRSEIIEAHKSDVVLAAIYPHLPPDIQAAVRNMPLHQGKLPK